MEITILGTESLGVRGLCCLVRAGDRQILIDPGVALGYLRHGLLPHPCQVAVGSAVRERILAASASATDIVISHYHGDHLPLADANPYQIPLRRLSFSSDVRFWCKGPCGCSSLALRRRQDLMDYTGRELPAAEGTGDGVLNCSEAVPHGTTGFGRVMMTTVRDSAATFVHASDIQLLSRQALEVIRSSEPTIVIASGPPLYLPQISLKERASARENALLLAGIPTLKTLILDHHLLRSTEGYQWLEALSDETGGRVVPAAAFMKRKALPLEANREDLYRRIPVPAEWHAAYARGEVGYMDFAEECGLLEEADPLMEMRGVVV